MRQQLKVRKERAVLVGAESQGNFRAKSDSLSELTALAESAGAVVVDRFRQKLRRINPATYIGSGKAEMLADRAKKFTAQVVIFDNDLSPAQIRELEKILKVKVIDRSELILDIFATRAKTKQAKLQVELAQLEYTYPRLTRMWGHLDTVAGAGGAGAVGAVGGIGTRGTGEKQLEIDRRLVSKRITELKRELLDIDKRKIREIDARRSFYKICIVGYTNAGKSTLLNALTESNVTVEDKLFATLDTSSRRLRFPREREIIVTDTVGFIRDLPKDLLAAFKATLEELGDATLLLHVIDVGNPHYEEQIESVEAILEELGLIAIPRLNVFNKTDKLDPDRLEVIRRRENGYYISARNWEGLIPLLKAMETHLWRELVSEVTLNTSAGNVSD